MDLITACIHFLAEALVGTDALPMEEAVWEPGGGSGTGAQAAAGRKCAP